MALVRRQAAEAAAPTGFAATDSRMSAITPTLVEWLTRTVWDDGAKRRTGTLMLLAEDGVWKVWMHDRDAAESAWVSGGSLEELLLAVEENLATGGGTWRKDAKGRK